MEKLNIVMIARHCCIRVSKIALPLIYKRHNVHIIGNRMPYFGEHYKSVSVYNNLNQLTDAIDAHRDADIFHVHNEPSWFVTAVKQVVDKPVILDAHDSLLIRYSPEDENPDHIRISVDERNNFQLADGHVFVSDSMAKVCRDEFSLKQPYIILPSYVPEHLYRLDSFKWFGGIVYEGRVDLPEKFEQKKEHPFFKYCEYTKLAKELYAAGIPFHLYTPSKNPKYQEVYGDTAIWQGSYFIEQLIRKLGRHNWGLVGNIDYHEDWQHAMPNKLFEYLAAGLPVLAMNAKAAGDFVEQNGFGFHVKTVDDIVRVWKMHRECRANVAKYRRQWTMEEHIHKVETLYDEVLNGNQNINIELACMDCNHAPYEPCEKHKDRTIAASTPCIPEPLYFDPAVIGPSTLPVG